MDQLSFLEEKEEVKDQEQLEFNLEDFFLEGMASVFNARGIE